MDERMQLPPRLKESNEMEALISDLPAMRTIIEHHRRSRNPSEQSTGRKLQACVQVQLWVDDDGRESIVVLGDESAGPLVLKGLLHDAVYALAHEGEPGFIPQGS